VTAHGARAAGRDAVIGFSRAKPRIDRFQPAIQQQRRKRPAIFAPGKEYDYCNTNYVLLGLIAEKLEGAPLAKIFQDRLFRPLGMKHTLLPANTSNTIPEPYSHGYLYGGSSYALVDAPYPADLRAAAKAGALKPNDDTEAESFLCLRGRSRHLDRG
jgi:D-alanyl-D-alanine carboxypeptidase